MDSVLKDRNENNTNNLSPVLNLSFLKNDEKVMQENAKENHNPRSLLDIARDSTKMINTKINDFIKKDEIVLNNNEKIENKHVDLEHNSTLTIEENHNPKSLLDIASDTSTVLKLKNTSTPLNSKRLSRTISHESNLNEDSYSMPLDSDTDGHKIPGLSFLVDEMDKIKMDVSEDEEEFLSVDSIQTSSTQIQKENVSDEAADKTIVDETKTQENIEMPPTIDKIELNEIQKCEVNNEKTFNMELPKNDSVQIAEDKMEETERIEIPIIIEHNEQNDMNERQKVTAETEKVFNIIEPATNNSDNSKSSTNNKEEVVSSNTEFMFIENIQNNRDDLKNSHENENIEELEKEDSMKDVTMKSIDESIEKNEKISQNEEIANVTNTISQKSPLKAETFEFAQPLQFSQPIAVIVTPSPSNELFTNASSYNFGDSDFEFLQKLGKLPSDDLARDSVLLKFDPLFEKPVPLQQLSRLSEAKEEESFSDLMLKEIDINQNSFDQDNKLVGNLTFSNIDEYNTSSSSNNAKSMNVDIMKDISSQHNKIDSNLECEDIKLSSTNNEDLNLKLKELEIKLKMEAEQREEGLLKRISEKDKQISKMNNVVEAYEKAIAELIAEKEQLIQSYEKKCNDLKGDSEMNAQHLASLESTFSDLHAKYERTKQLASELKEREESILQDRKSLQDSLKMQEARYEKMKTHAMSQLEIANNKLADMLRNHQAEVTKLKAQLKKEEISRASVHEQLIQKSKENAELVKICDELIGNHGNSQTA
ncbi:hypothetical protein PVAND_011405 [Polypedilum vanderplanki]|uniref:Transforming acidic coiled-coil-containing protein C-terminal domain-containing protein n=1 Tax=Polypedilum vanderplanki TaxID=319348 RepID=A0A9J6CIG7_POLVA|nr:hypothetical protein PVAND_011405 [Polypedilum vanderplanki]